MRFWHLLDFNQIAKCTYARPYILRGGLVGDAPAMHWIYLLFTNYYLDSRYLVVFYSYIDYNSCLWHSLLGLLGGYLWYPCSCLASVQMCPGCYLVTPILVIDTW